MTSSSESSARVRIRDAALERFGRDGINRVTVRAIAAEAGVSPALVVHHFGSMEGLRRECDAYLASVIRGQGETPTDPNAIDVADLASVLRSSSSLRRYLARALLDGTDQAAALFDEIVRSTAGWLDEGVRQGWAEPTEQPHARAVLYVSWLLAPLVLDHHVARALDLDDPLGGDEVLRFAPTMFEMLTRGVFTDQAPTDNAWRELGRHEPGRPEPGGPEPGGRADDRGASA